MIRSSFRTTQFIPLNLLNLYFKFSAKATAYQVFDKMPNRDVATHNSLMTGNSQMGDSSGERKLDVRIEQFSYTSALSACADAGDLRKGRMIHGLAVTTGLSQQPFLTNSLICMYSKCARINEARFAFDHGAELDNASWNSLFSVYVEIGWPEVAVNILVWMHRFGAQLNCFALSSVLKACLGFNDSHDIRRMVYGCVIKIGLDLELFEGSVVVNMYAENGGMDEVIKVFDQMPNPNLAVFSAMIAGLSWLGAETCPKVRLEALRLYSEMLRRGMRPSKFTYRSVLRACKLGKAFKCGKQIHAQVITSNLQDDEFVANTLIELYSNSGLMEDSFRCFESTKKESVAVWTSLISGYVLNGHFESALSFFTELLRFGRKPDQFMISSLSMACANLGVLRSGEQIHCHATKAGLDRLTVCANSLTEMYAKLGDLESAIMAVEDIGTLGVDSWSAVILSHALNGCERDALNLFEEMKDGRVAPSHVTFLAVLIACDHGGLIDEGFKHFKSMQVDYCMAPTTKHLACIIDLLGRLGRLADAEDLIRDSGFGHEPLVWRVLLHSCEFHGDNERGIHAGERLMELEPLEAISYMQLYNMYLNVGKISLAMRTRGLMRERGVNKETGVCWIEMGGLVHSFGPGDYSHPQSHTIYAKLEEMLFKIKHMVQPNVKILQLEYRSEKWKENLKNSHGEMLAVAIGMVGLPEEVPIRVMKSSRVCVDCHATLKLFSESERREIVLRDPTRIHHFQSGSCSCGDYW